jgi:monofunctional biosynthetic peptidoglycan transglycosylase
MPVRLPFHRIRVWAFRLTILFLAATLLPVIALRFLPPIATTLMVERRIESLFREGKYSPTYDWVSFDKISPAMSAAVIASEDQNFLQHSGFDWKAIQKALDHNERSTRTKGASTLSQQTAKNVFLWSRRSWVRKGFEAYFTFLLELFWNKRRILETYLNVVEFGDGIYGVEAAARRYFGKPASKLNASEAALLAAVLPSPRRYSVKSPGPYVRERQQWILRQMEQLGGVSMVKTIR